MKQTRGLSIVWAVLAAALYALNAPVSKLLLDSAPPRMMAAFLYLGAGAGMLAVGAVQWIVAVIGWVLIVYVMFSGAKRLELRQNRSYGSDPEYRAYVEKTPIILPFIPLYHLEGVRFIVV